MGHHLILLAAIGLKFLPNLLPDRMIRPNGYSHTISAFSSHLNNGLGSSIGKSLLSHFFSIGLHRFGNAVPQVTVDFGKRRLAIRQTQ